ncbi:thioredoxin [Enterococcus cecorum]|uniref:thioredoxin n=1 Tax=Enterococcus cecorum TaxID=44008 RepID=UPI0022D7AEF8|nr:thioredoxin [Enterococcus cecorum]CAI3321300.1 thioredoxin [Enterococcus cecorum]CAI3331780.1 thioredoxin [Enterococcus cecorum]CAI3372036.1 thioredoxin [Enterococcus cecorum]CAI3379911.1 thioredoxin [Enterococcus cecorum]CAI3380809.1 thioredoxin [Enterococcus cecorum]
MAKEITDATFSQEISEGLVLVDFWAPWCGPCRMQAPILDQLSQKYDETELKITKLNVDDNPQTAASFGVMSIPTLLFFKDGELVEKRVGVQPKPALEEIIEKLS